MAIAGSQSWIFQANPGDYNLRGAVRKLPKIGWIVTKYKNRIGYGDRLYLWESGQNGGIVALATAGPVGTGPMPLDRFQLNEPERDDPAWMWVRVVRVVDPVLRRDKLRQHKELAELSILRNPRGAQFPVREKEARVLDGLLEEGRVEDTYLSPSEAEASGSGILEGARISVLVNRFERDPDARRQCIERFGVICSVCGFDFQKKYGDIGTGFIHAHHLIPLHKIGGQYKLNVETDLRPVCPNCHAMLHRVEPLLSLKQLKSRLRHRA